MNSESRATSKSKLRNSGAPSPVPKPTPPGKHDREALSHAGDGGEVSEDAEAERHAKGQLDDTHPLGEAFGVGHHHTLHEGAEELGSLRDEAPGLEALGELSGELGV